jgi:hypothetical protein
MSEQAAAAAGTLSFNHIALADGDFSGGTTRITATPELRAYMRITRVPPQPPDVFDEAIQ